MATKKNELVSLPDGRRIEKPQLPPEMQLEEKKESLDDNLKFTAKKLLNLQNKENKTEMDIISYNILAQALNLGLQMKTTIGTMESVFSALSMIGNVLDVFDAVLEGQNELFDKILKGEKYGIKEKIKMQMDKRRIRRNVRGKIERVVEQMKLMTDISYDIIDSLSGLGGSMSKALGGRRRKKSQPITQVELSGDAQNFIESIGGTVTAPTENKEKSEKKGGKKGSGAGGDIPDVPTAD